MTSIGKLLALSLGYYYLQSTWDWKGLFFVLAMISIASPILVLLFVHDTPRYYLSKNDLHAAVHELNNMGQINQGGSYQELTIDEIHTI